MVFILVGWLGRVSCFVKLLIGLIDGSSYFDWLAGSSAMFRKASDW